MSHIISSLNRKSFYRSTYWKKSIGIKILVVFFVFYLSISLLILGFNIPAILQEYFPGQNVIKAFNENLLFYFIFSAILRQLFQEIPIVNSLPLLVLPFKKRKIAQHLVNKSFFHIINFLPLLFLVPFAFNTVLEEYELINTLGWLINLVGLILVNHLVGIWLKRFSFYKEKTSAIILGLGIGLFLLSFFKIIPLSSWIAQYFHAVLNYPALSLAPFFLIILLYRFNLNEIARGMYLDSKLIPAEKEVNIHSFSWTDKFGAIGKYISLELKMITRNKRTRTAFLSVIFLLFYGFILYGNSSMANHDFSLVFIGILITGSFSISYGQFTPAWHSKYFPFLMTRDFGLKNMLNTQYFLFMASTLIAFIFSTVYLIYGTEVLFFNFLSAIFNIGVTSHIILWMGSFSIKPIDLSESSFFYYKGTGASVWIMSLIIMLGPMLYYGLLSMLLKDVWCYLVFGLTGVGGIVFHESIMNRILLRYKKNKHRMLYSYRQST
ncbi:DUF5687 family protein [Marinilabilia rubra]|uniref:Uncharacterized protein n=1 Tax=Marinilabilia rubra TaxID=2162893 RepID=A0A2U2BB95_9BACT|nr:DUF5687 family protein [Marinilabilia rubra]PWE00329.1 hypothetical protein DDZ16_05155 [Marinilabilia rubra]